MIGVIGGSGLYRLEGVEVVERVRIRTPFGEPSSDVVIARIEGKELAFLSRHGEGHVYPPHLVPYRANLWAFRELGIKRVLAVSAVGAINRRFKPGDFVLVDDLLDFTKGRKDTYYEGKFSLPVKGDDRVAELLSKGKVVHIDAGQLYCPQMRSVLMETLEGLKLPYHPSGVYACTEGPRFETPAEIRAIEKFGGDVVGMTGYPEVVLARELTMCYASLCVVANPAAGIAGYRLTSEEVISLMKKREEEIGKLILEFIERLPEDRTCGCDRILEGAEV
ncbi:MAG: S-methyl-5'-thioadenosine phosphorylase [Aquificaceae bacterium]|jgi:5'-methylthioadenosine phosphorylase|uniref:S-methyl-5'-thioadenosine phosphorylase n=1 Tax=Hydrogenobacter sp. Uz 6-8 TaxID=3384828 RepID=UPI0030B3C3A1